MFHESNFLITSLNEENSESHYVQLESNTQLSRTHQFEVHQLVSNEIATEVPGRPRIPIVVTSLPQPVGTATTIDSENSATSSTMFLRLIHQLVST